MKKLTCLIALLFFIFPILVFAESVTLEWDANDPAPEGYRLFQRQVDGEYGENVWQGTGTRATIEVFGTEEQTTTFYFVVRAFVGASESGNSNEVNYTIDLISPSPVSNFTAEYNIATNEIQLQWTQIGQEEIAYWKVFVSETAGGPYTEFDTVENTGPASAISSKTLNVNNGEIKTFYFTIVSFKNDDLYSANSIEIEKIVDRQALSIINTLKIVVE